MLLKSLLALCIVGLAVGAYWQATTSASNNSAKKMIHPIEEKARKAKANDESSIRELADAVFNDVGTAIPTDIMDHMKDRLVRAEIKFRHGNKKIRESNIVLTLNDLAERFDAPAYAKTSPLQVRTMRVELMKMYPSFIAQDTEDTSDLKKKVGAKLKDDVSPLEAAYITMLIVHQKMLNDEWQQTPDEWFHSQQKKRFLDDSQNTTPQVGEPDSEKKQRNDAKRREMQAVVARAIANMSTSDVQNLIDSSLDNLGVER
jgi:hypothetical protein